MVTIGFWQCLDFQNNKDYFFNKKKENILGEDPIETLKSLFYAKKKFKYKIELLNIKKIFEYDLIIFSNWPINIKIAELLKKRTKPNYLLALEGPTIDEETWKESNHIYFKKIFTWNDSFISRNNKKYIKINFPCYKKKNYRINFKKKKFLISISSNKKNTHKNDLYKKRLEFINWAEENNFFKFDFYGYGWNLADLKNKYIIKILKILKFLNIFFIKKYKNYKGEYFGIKKKLMKEYKFALCFENSKNYNGWITEKIFHCFFSGCIPIYYGAKNITNIIPSNCFVDYRKFKSKKDLILFLQNIDDKEFKNYIKNISKFLSSAKFNNHFNIQIFTKRIFKEIQNDLKLLIL